jgi:hypothetical protein
VTEPVIVLHHRVVGVLVAHEEGASHGAAVGIEEVLGEDLESML